MVEKLLPPALFNEALALAEQRYLAELTHTDLGVAAVAAGSHQQVIEWVWAPWIERKRNDPSAASDAVEATNRRLNAIVFAFDTLATFATLQLYTRLKDDGVAPRTLDDLGAELVGYLKQARAMREAT